MSKSIEETTKSQDLPASEPAEARARAAVEAAQGNVRQTREELVALRQRLGRHVELAGAFDRLASRLMDLTSATAAGAASGAVERQRLVVVVEPLAAMARNTATAVRELEGTLRSCMTATDSAVTLADDAQLALGRLADSLRSIDRFATGTPQEVTAPLPQAPVAKAADDNASSKEQRLAEYLRRLWPASVPGSTDLKN